MSEPAAEDMSPDGPDGRESSDGVAPDTESSATSTRAAEPDPPLLRDAFTAANATLAGLTSLHGASISAHTVIVGDASVGTLVGRDQSGIAQGRVFVPSGPVETALLKQLEDTFVPPRAFHEMRSKLHAQPLVLLRAARGWGRTAAALRALDETCTGAVHKLNPDVRLRSLEIDFATGTGYLLEALEVEQTTTLHAFHCDELSRALRERDSRMIVVLDSHVELSADVGTFLVEGGEPADAMELVGKHLRWHLPGGPADLLAEEDMAQVVSDVAQSHPSARDLALLARQLADVASGRIELADVIERYSAVADERFQQWFDDELNVQTRSFAIALAVFNGMPSHFVSDAGRRLARLIADEEIPNENGYPWPVFSTRRATVLSDVKAELYQSIANTEYGRIPVQSVRFTDDQYPRRVLEHAWHEYHASHQALRDWLRELGDTADLEVCTRTGVAVGMLSTFEFEHARKLVIEPWADSGEWHLRFAAIGALQFPSLQPEFAPVIARMLAAWLRKDQPLPRRETAAVALGSTVGQTMPNRALELLRRAARSTELSLVAAVCHAMLQLFSVSELTERVLTELRSWTGSRRITLRDTGFRCALELSAGLDVDTPRGARTWPVMVWLADKSPENHDHIVTLFARLMEAPIHMPTAYEEIGRWVRVAEKDTQLRGPLGRLLIDLGHAIADTEMIPFYLRDWAAERNGPVHAVDDLLTMIEQKDIRP
ncbi:hypothetical protein ACIBCN_41445 [Nocardia sp. NPDC051052]|uniref:hypothetical protein n=1 Tax=Nocardia sp. NPDC051052 TaxID=3364322 RepID=UPI0037997767